MQFKYFNQMKYEYSNKSYIVFFKIVRKRMKLNCYM